MIQLNRMMRKDELALFSDAADAVSRSGLGTHSYTVAERQIVPGTGEPIEEDSPFLVVTYRGQEDTGKLYNIIQDAKVAFREQWRNFRR
jgi:hypothetical protein